jgi:uncharacterized repeat protein (TIGR03803 family)
MNTNLIKPHHENVTEANKGNKDQFFVNFVAFCKIVLWIAILVLSALGASAGVVFTTLYSFTGTNDGANPAAGLVQGGDGYFYGTTCYGGTNTAYRGFGTVFRIGANGSLTSLHSFNGHDGWNPVAGLVQGIDGNFYGTTAWGGPPIIDGLGTVFKITTTGMFTNLYTFGHGGGGIYGVGNDGANPFSGLVQARDGTLYGTTELGGPNYHPDFFGWGTVFQISTNGVPINWDATCYAFTNGTSGAYPVAGLVQDSDGNLYGTTLGYDTIFAVDLASSCPSTVFKITTNGSLITLHSFTGANDGEGVLAGLVRGRDGNFYGTTSGGGTNGGGTVFKITTNGALTTLYSFGTITNASGVPLDGGDAGAALVQGSDGTLYGTTAYGGTSSNGSVFAVNTDGTGFGTLYSFSPSSTNTSGFYEYGNGGNPQAWLVQGSDGSFYGTTYAGGTSGLGTVFRLTIVPEFQGATISNEMINLTWSTEAGGTYQLQYTSDLTSTNWINSAFVATGSSMTISDWVFNSSQRFYRLKVIIAPDGAVDCVASGTQSNYISFVKGLQALAEAYNLGATLQSLQGGVTSLYDVMTLDTNGCVIAYCNANLQWGCFLGQTSSSCTLDGALPAGLPVIAWGSKAPCSGEHVVQW